VKILNPQEKTMSDDKNKPKAEGVKTLRVHGEIIGADFNREYPPFSETYETGSWSWPPRVG
jgi:hypothetical protein